MSEASTVNRQWPRKRAPKVETKSKRRYFIWAFGAMSILLLSGLGIAWATGYFDKDPRVVEITNLGKQLDDPSLTDKQRRELFRTLRKDMEDLPENLRKPLEAQGREMMQKRDAEKLAAFFKLSPEEQKLALQKDIDRMVRRQKEREERMAQAAANPDKSAGDNPPGSGGARMVRDRAGRGQGSPGVERWPPSAEQQMAFGKQRINNTTPEYRAQRSLYNSMLQQQAAAQGVPMRGRWNGGMGGFSQ